LLADVADADLQTLAARVRILKRKKGARIFEEGSVADSCYIVVSGRAAVALTGRYGAETTIGLVLPFELVGEIALLDRAPRTASLIATQDCVLLQLPAAPFHALRAQRAFEDRLVAHVTTTLRRATEQLRAIFTYSVADRVLWCLSTLAARTGRRTEKTLALAPKPTHQDIASMTGCSRETVSRTLVQLRRTRALQWNDREFLLSEAVCARYASSSLPVEARTDVTRFV
jgi:CRP-like cAMP-binding protein